MWTFFILGLVSAEICKKGRSDNRCTLLPTVTLTYYLHTSTDCSGASEFTDIWTDYTWGVCESKTTTEPARIVRCTGDEDTLRVEEYESDYCTDLSPSSTFTITKNECVNYRDTSGTLYKRTASWSYTGGLTCPSGDVNIGVKKYGVAGCESNPSSEWVEIIPRLNQCFNSTTPNLGDDIRRSVECSGSSGTITEYTDTNDPFQNCTTQATSFDISNGACIEWTDPTDSARKEYRRMYFDCSTSFSATFAVFWVVLVAIYQY